MTEYKLFVQSMYDRSVGFYETYGISVYDNGEIRRIVRDVSLERDRVKSLINRFNLEQLDPAHLSQAVEEFLYDFKT